MTTVCYSNKADACTVLGPGSRAVLWVQGCCFDCPGCIGHRYHSALAGGTQATAQELAAWYCSCGADGLTISGGEPFLQAGALARMVELIRAQADCGTIVYTGFVYEELCEKARDDQGVAALLQATDLLIDGPYVQELDDGRPYVGSSNQRLIPLTSRYERALASYYGAETTRRIEIRLSEQGTLMMGVPAHGQAEVWQKVKRLGETGGRS